jgi:hypothetical protein
MAERGERERTWERERVGEWEGEGGKEREHRFILSTVQSTVICHKI